MGWTTTKLRMRWEGADPCPYMYTHTDTHAQAIHTHTACTQAHTRAPVPTRLLGGVLHEHHGRQLVAGRALV